MVQRLISVFLILVMCVSALPLNVMAWSYMSHTNSANLIHMDLLNSFVEAGGTVDTIPEVTLYSPYDDHSEENIYSYTIPEEYWLAINNYPDAFRAGALGPDFYPDMVTGQMYAHPYDGTVPTGEWISLLCESVNKMPQYSEGRLEALAFTLGCMLHYCGDMFGHDFVNTFTGGAFPSLSDVNFFSTKDGPLNNILSHMSIESFMDDLVNDEFYNQKDMLDISAPTTFVTDTMVLDGNATAGAAEIFGEGYYNNVMLLYRKLLELRGNLKALADERRASTEVFTMALATYFDLWIEDIDTAIYELANTFDMIANRLVTGKKNPKIEEKKMEEWLTGGIPLSDMLLGIYDLDPSSLTVAIIKEELSLWLDEYGYHTTFVPDIFIDGIQINNKTLDTILDMNPINLLLNQVMNCIKGLFALVISAVIDGIVDVDDLKALAELLDDRLDNPAVQLDHEDNPFRPFENNFAELSDYLILYVREQELLSDLSGKDLSSESNNVIDTLMDSEFEAFYNTLTLFKLILMGPENFSDFIEAALGQTQTVYKTSETYLEATVIRMDITTADLQLAGSDDNIYVSVFRVNEDGSRTEVARKLLDNPVENNFESGNTDVFYVHLTEPIRVDQLEFLLHQKGTLTAYGEWQCENVVITPMHAGVALTEPIGVGGNLYMDDGVIWELNFRKALARRGTIFGSTSPVTNIELKIKTKEGSIFNGTDYEVYVDILNGENNLVDSVLIDKYLYNDFEAGDYDIYNIPVVSYNESTGEFEGIPLDNLIFFIRHDAKYEWEFEYVDVTYYYGNLPIGKTGRYMGKTLSINDSVLIDIRKTLRLEDWYCHYEPITYSYTTSVDSGILKDMKSLDESEQWVNLPILWDSKEGRELFFKLFKGFRPEVEFEAPTSVESGTPFTMNLSFEGMWNGVRAERRNQVAGVDDMPDVKGNVTVSFINGKGEVVCTTQAKSLFKNQVIFNNYTSEALVPDIYDVKITYTADSEDPMYGDAEYLYTDALKVIGSPVLKFSLLEPAPSLDQLNEGVTDLGKVKLGSSATDITFRMDAEGLSSYLTSLDWTLGRSITVTRDGVEIYNKTYAENIVAPSWNLKDNIDEGGTYLIEMRVFAKRGRNMMVEKTHTYRITVEGSTIKTIAIDGVGTPVLGKTFSEKVTVRTEGVKIKDVEWGYYTELHGGGWSAMNAGEVFEAGKRYRVDIELKTANRYAFAADVSEMTAYINGQEAAVTSWYHKATESAISLEFTPIAAPAFTVQPVGGEAPSSEQLPYNWELNFTPVKQVEHIITATGSVDYPLDVNDRSSSSSAPHTLTIRAYYNDTEYVESNVFHVTEKLGTIRGEITSHKDADAVISVELLRDGVVAYSTTCRGSIAFFDLMGITPGTYTLRVTKPGNAPFEKVIHVNVGAEIGITIPLVQEGDIDGDEAININDVVILFRYTMLPDLYPIPYTGDADFDQDGLVNILDVIRLFRFSMLPDLYPLK